MWIATGLFITLSVLPVSAEINFDTGTILKNEYAKINPIDNSTSSYNETEVVEQELSLSLRFLASMLHLLDLNLDLINETLNEHSAEYPFLQSTIEEVSTGLEAVNSAIVVMETSPENMSKANFTLNTFDSAVSDLNESLVYPQDMFDAANATLGQSEDTTPLLGDLFEVTKAMVTTYDNI
ncbi:hypothetical protein [Methanosarcina sp. 1.H.T.1A.1]|uniref:hypothetical protein n=1 Tax=Methanosarcina sp. 1.H.T.1A.1 TaxID=1483602 RepID=UPI000A8B5340|nr:hypothetical protein [Methanosarcina sp. 1.H.T.1A.1]